MKKKGKRRKLNILQVSNTYLPTRGGTELVVSDFSKELARRGHNVTVLATTLYAPGAHVGEEMIDGVRVIRERNDAFALGFGFSATFPFKLARLWKGYDIAHIHGYSRFASEFALFYLKGKLPIVFTGHGFTHTANNSQLKHLHAMTFGKLVRLADACTALTPLEHPKYHALGVPDSRIFDIPNGVDVKRFSKPAGQRKIASLRRAWGVKPGESVVLFVGRVHPSKGLAFLVDAVAGLSKVRLVIAGPDHGFSKTLLERANIRGVKGRMVIAGKIPDEMLPAAYQAADMFSLPSEMEGFGLVLVEAMAAGLPIVCSDRGAMPYLVKDGQTGFVCRYGDVELLREKLGILASKPKLAKAMGARGKKLAVEYDLPRVVDKLEKVYYQVLSGKGQ